jgi:hypothetical protein
VRYVNSDGFVFGAGACAVGFPSSCSVQECAKRASCHDRTSIGDCAGAYAYSGTFPQLVTAERSDNAKHDNAPHGKRSDVPAT